MMAPAYRGCARPVGDVDRFSPATPGSKKQSENASSTWKRSQKSLEVQPLSWKHPSFQELSKYTAWWLGQPSEKYTSESQLGWWMTPNISWENRIGGNQPTNQYMVDVLENSWINFEIESLAVSRLRVGRPSRPKRAEKEIYLHDPVGPLVCGRGKSRKGNTAWWVSTNGIIGSFSIIFWESIEVSSG